MLENDRVFSLQFYHKSVRARFFAISALFQLLDAYDLFLKMYERFKKLI